MAVLFPRLRFIALAAFVAIGATPAQAGEPVKLTGPEIKALFDGNSVDGIWGQAHYHSYFDPAGMTLYQEEGRPPQEGRWHISDTQYCSRWEPGGTSCYDIYRDGEQIIWVGPDSSHRYSSVLISGKAVPW
jgi:hypothetical protein